jgi:NADPH:quinone reductase-like Zn-dependent oxidoreductase
LLQSAAGSELGKMIIRLCRRDGIRTINVVRRRSAIEELKALGGDVVLCSEDGPIDEQVRHCTDGSMVRSAIDPVGGETGRQMFESLAEGGTLVLFGTLSGEPLVIDPRRMIAVDRVVRGFWLGHWMRQRSIPSSLLLFREIVHLIREGVLKTDLGASFPMEQIDRAVGLADSAGRRGKVMLEIGVR